MKNKQAALPFILVTVLLDMLGIGLIIPVLPKLVTSLYGGTLSEGAHAFGWFIAVYALMQFVCAPIIGNLSDVFGRRAVLLVSLLGASLDYLLMAFAPTWEWLFAGRVIAGITGANITAANAYIADISTEENRAKNFGMLGACFGVGFILGPALGGLLVDFGARVPFLVAAGLTLLNWLYGLLVLPESLPVERRRSFSLKHANPLASLGSLARNPIILGLAATNLLERIAHDSLPSTWVLYTTFRFGWTERQNGLSLTLVGLMYALVSAGLTATVVKKLGARRALIFGLCIGATEFLLMGLATQGWMLYAAIVFGSLSGVAAPALQTIITSLTPATEQGAVQGAFTSLQSIAAIAGPLLATSLFGYFSAPQAGWRLPGAAFLASALLVGAGALLAWRSARQTTDLPPATVSAD